MLVAILAVIATISTIGFLLMLWGFAIFEEYMKDLIVKETLDEDIRAAAKKVRDRFFE